MVWCVIGDCVVWCVVEVVCGVRFIEVVVMVVCGVVYGVMCSVT
jgi:hypothetical protein